MRRVLLLLLTITPLMLLSSCRSWNSTDIPYGVWKSKDPELILDIKPGNYGDDVGQYINDGETIEVIVMVSRNHQSIGIYDLSADKGYAFNTDNPYFWGTYKFDDTQIYYNFNSYWREKTGYKNIIFEKIESYEIPEDKKADSFWAGFIKPPFTDVIIPAILILPVYLCPLFIKRRPRN